MEWKKLHSTMQQLTSVINTMRENIQRQLANEYSYIVLMPSHKDSLTQSLLIRKLHEVL